MKVYSFLAAVYLGEHGELGHCTGTDMQLRSVAAGPKLLDS